MRMNTPESILVVRRDNIGDLVCTTPLFALLRQRVPRAWIGAWVNRYNAPVLHGHPDVDAVYVYAKSKHRLPGESRTALLGARLRALVELRRRRIDWLILPHSGSQPSAERVARWLAPRRVLRPSEGGADRHEVVRVCSVLQAVGMLDGETPLPPLKVVPDAGQVARLRAELEGRRRTPSRPLIALHLSARKPSQRLPLDRWLAVIERLSARADLMLLWAPGGADDPQHPGDDALAQSLLEALGRRGVRPALTPIPTRDLASLIAALAICDAAILSDGGAMHLAAGLGKPVVALFGATPPAVWRPWGVTHRVLRPPSREVRELDAAAIVDACFELPVWSPAAPEA